MFISQFAIPTGESTSILQQQQQLYYYHFTAIVLHTGQPVLAGISNDEPEILFEQLHSLTAHIPLLITTGTFAFDRCQSTPSH